jgi:hypothetical protein
MLKAHVLYMPFKNLVNMSLPKKKFVEASNMFPSKFPKTIIEMYNVA